MAERTQSMTGDEPWNEYLNELNETASEVFAQNMEIQSQFIDSWLAALDEATMDEQVADGITGSVRAYEVWMEAAEAQFELVEQAMVGEDVEPEAFRDIWLNAANDAFKEVMGTSAFAAATGQTVGETLSASQQLDEMSQETLHSLGFGTRSDIQEVGERLLELERRQHAVERKLDRVLTAVDAGADSEGERDAHGDEDSPQ